jgi:3-oxoacyl-[acyl-carrier-protein] synthase II
MSGAGARAVITGVGTVTGLGAGGAAAVGPALESGRSAIGPVGAFPTQGLASHLAGEVPSATLGALTDPAEARRMSRVSQITVAACRLALRDAGLDGEADVHLVVGTEFGDLRSSEEFVVGYLRRGVGGLSPLMFPNTVMNTMAASTAIALGLRGVSITLNARRVAGELAIARAHRLIACGRARTVLAGGVDEISVHMFEMLTRLGWLSPRDGGAEGSRPFDRRANGVVLGEGATFVVLESPDSARARGARILGEVRGAAWRTGARASAVRAALAAAALAPGDIGWIYSGAAGDPAHDAAHLASIRDALGAHPPAVTTLSPLFGEHAGLGALRVAAGAWTARTGRLPGITSLEQPTEAAQDLAVGSGVHRVPAGPGLVHGAVRRGDSVALVVGPA